MKPLWVGPKSPELEKALLGLQTRWPDAQFTITENVAQATDIFLRNSFDVAFIHLEGGEGVFTFVHDLREVSDIPLFAVAGQASNLEAVKALYGGADGVITEDHGPMEIQAMMMAILRRLQGHTGSVEKTIQVGDLQISATSHEVYLSGQPLHLTPTEFRLLHALAQRRGMLATHDSLLRSIWGEGADGNVLRKYIQRLRSKLNDDHEHPRWIVTVPAIGYRLIGDGKLPNDAGVAVVEDSDDSWVPTRQESQRRERRQKVRA